MQRCAALDRVLPTTLVGLDARHVSPASPLTNAWGSPAVTLTCGVPKPATYFAPTGSTIAVDNVLWFETVQGNKVIWTAIRHEGRSAVFVALVVPRTYPAADAFLAALAAPIKSALPISR